MLSIKGTLKEAFSRIKGTKFPVFICFLGLLFGEAVGLVVLNILMLNFFGIDYLHFIQSTIKHPGAQLFSMLFTLLVLPFLLASFMGGMAMLGLLSARQQPISKTIGFHYFNKTIPIAVLQILLFIVTMITIFILNFLGFTLVGLFSMLMHSLLGKSTVIGVITVILAGGIIFIDLFVCMVLVLSVQLSMLLVMDKNLNPFKAIIVSLSGISKHIFKSALIAFICLVILALAAVTIIGLLWAVPFMLNAFGILYRELIDNGVIPAQPATN